MKRRPNIVLCMADQLRAFELGCYGHSAVRSPHIDALAQHVYGLPWAGGTPGEIADQPHVFHDLRNDPYEQRHLARTDEQRDIAQQLHARLTAWHARTPWMKTQEPAR